MTTLPRWFTRLLAPAVALLAVSAATVSAQPAEVRAGNRIEKLDFSTLQGGRVQLRLTLQGRMPNPPAGFAVNKPPRIALDFPGVTNALGKTAYVINESVLKGVNIVAGPARTRLVLNLTRPAQYETRMEDNQVLVTLSATEAAAAAEPTSRFAEARPGAARHTVRDVDFRRGPDGAGRVAVSLSDTGAGINIRRQGSQLVVDLLDAELPRALERRLDVSDFGTPVQTVDAFRQGDDVRLVIEPEGAWEHFAYQTDGQFIVEVKRGVSEEAARNALAAKPKYTGEKLSLNFQNVEVRSVLQVIADFTGLNIITSDTVTGNLTLRLKDVPWDQALDIILQAKGLSMRKTGNVIMIAPTDELATKEKLALEAKQQIEDLEPIYTESFQLNYQKAENFLKLFNDEKQKLLSKRGSAVIDPRTNTLFIRDTTAKLDEIRALVAKVDVPVRQVEIEARIVIADDKFRRELGARFGVRDQGRINTTNTGIGGTLDDSAGVAFGGIGNSTLGNVNLPVVGAFGSLGFSLLSLGSSTLVSLELSALEADERGKVISNPRVLTADKQKAMIEQGTEIPYQQATASGATSIEFKPATLSLTVTPQITPDDRIIMDLEVKKDSVGQIFAGVPSVDTRKVITQILVNNGETAVLGGIYEQTVRNDVDKVPLFGDLPVLGNLFKNTARRDEKTELLIFITPRVVKESLNIR